MTLYSLKVDEEPVCEVEMEAPEWLPVRPRLNTGWLKTTVAKALHNYFSRIATSSHVVRA
jgi:hypothetical protein